MMNALIVLFSLVVFTPAQAEERTDCTEWSKKLATIIAPSSANAELEFLPQQNLKNLIAHLEAYPEDGTYDIERLNTKSKAEAAERMMSAPTCKIMAYFDAMKGILQSKKFSQKERASAVNALFHSILKQDSFSAGLIGVIIKTELIRIAIETKALKVSDSAYFGLNALQTQIDLYHIGLRNFGKDEVYTCVSEKKNCTASDYEKIYPKLSDEYTHSRAFTKNLVRWVKRVQG